VIPQQTRRGSPPKKIASRAGDSSKTQPPFIRWSIKEIRRIATRLAQRHIRPAHVIAWSIWRRAHQANVRQVHLKMKMQL